MQIKLKCNKCGQCCKGSMGPFVFPSDVIKISNGLGIDKRTFINTYCNENIISINKNSICIYSLKSTNTGCIFLNNNLCDIYSYRPYQCVNAPYNFLSQSELWNHMRCLDKELLQKCDTTDKDIKIFKEILDIGYILD